MSLESDAFQLAYEISPIMLVGGIAANLGGVLPLIAITEPANFTANALNAGSITNVISNGAANSGLIPNMLDLNKVFAHWRPVPGGTLADNELGTFPYLNIAVAANSIIVNPLKLSMLMQVPVNGPGGYVSKLVTMSALQAAMLLHMQLGGSFTISTPAFIYTNMLLLLMRDVTPNDTKQVQTAWQWDFVNPLLSNAQALGGALGALLSKVSAGLPTSLTSWSGLA